MTDANVISIAITLFAIAAGSLFNNVRIADSTTATNKRFDDMRELFKSENARIARQIENTDAKIGRIAETLNTILKDHATRLRAIEQRH